MPKQDFMKFLKSLLPSPPAGDLGGLNPTMNLMEPSGPSQWWQGWYEHSAPEGRHISENLRGMRADRNAAAAERAALLDFAGSVGNEWSSAPLIPGLVRDMNVRDNMGYLERPLRAGDPTNAPLEMSGAIMSASPVARASEPGLLGANDFDFFSGPKSEQFREGAPPPKTKSLISDPGKKGKSKPKSADGENLLSSQEYLANLAPERGPGPNVGPTRHKEELLVRGFGDLDEGPSILFGDGVAPKKEDLSSVIDAEFSLVPSPAVGGASAGKESLSLVPVKNAGVPGVVGNVSPLQPKSTPKPGKVPSKSPKSDDSDFGFGDADFGLGGKAAKGKKGGKGKWVGGGLLAGLVGAGLYAGNEGMRGEESPDFFSNVADWQNVKPPTSIAGGKYRAFPFDVDMEKVGPVNNEEALARYLRQSAQTLSADSFRGQGRGDIANKEAEYQAWLDQAMKLVQDLAAKNNVKYDPQEVYEMAFTRWQDKNKSKKKK